MISFLFQKFGWFLPKRFVYVTSPDEEEKPHHSGSGEEKNKKPKPEAPEEKRHAPAGGGALGKHEVLEPFSAEKIQHPTTKKDISSQTILDRLRKIEDMRKAKDDRLPSQLIEWYGENTDPRYRAILGAINDENISALRDLELLRFRSRLKTETQLQCDEITRPHTLKTLQEALDHINTAATLTDKISKDTRHLLGQLNLHGESSAIKYLEAVHHKEDLEQEIKTAESELIDMESKITAHEKSKEEIWKKKKEWDEKKWAWLSPILKWGGIGAGVFTLGSGLWGLFKGFLSDSPLSGFWQGATVIPRAIKGLLEKEAGVAGLSSFNFAGAAVTGIAGAALAWHHWYWVPTLYRLGEHKLKTRELKEDLKTAKEQRGLKKKKKDLEEAERIIASTKTENTKKKALVQEKYDAYDKMRQELIGKNDPASVAKKRDILDALASLNTVKALYEISEGKYAEQIVDENLEHLGHFDKHQLIAAKVLALKPKDPRMEADLMSIVKREDEGVQEKQKTLSGLPEKGLEEEISHLTHDEEREIVHFLQDPAHRPLVGFLGDPSFPVKAPQLHRAVTTLKDFPYETAYQAQTANALLKLMEFEHKEIMKKEFTTALSEIKEDRTRKAIERNPKIIREMGRGIPAPNMISVDPEPSPGQNLESWFQSLEVQEQRKLLKLLEMTKYRTIDASGDRLVDRLDPLRTSIIGIFAMLDGSVRDLLNRDAASVFSSAAREFLKSEGKVYTFPKPETDFLLNSIGQITDQALLAELELLMGKMRDEKAYVEGNAVHFLSEDIRKIDEKYKQIPEESGIRNLIDANPIVLRTVEGTLPDLPTPAGRPGAPVPRNFKHYCEVITPGERKTVIEALTKILAPDPYVLTIDGINLEKEIVQVRRIIIENFINLGGIPDGANAQNHLNSANLRTVKSALSQAHHLINKSSKTFSLPERDAAGNTDFTHRINAYKNLSEMRDLKGLLDTLANSGSYRWNNGTHQFELI